MKRTVPLILGLFVLAGIWLGPLPRLAGQAFSAHMAMHMGIVAIAAPLLALGIAGGALDPVSPDPDLCPGAYCGLGMAYPGPASLREA